MPTGEPTPELAPGWRALMERCWAEEADARPTFSEIIKELRGMVSAIKPSRAASKSLANNNAMHRSPSK